MHSSLNIIDLFGAPGGFSLGFEMAGFKTVGAIDLDRTGIESFSRNFPEANGIVANLCSNFGERSPKNLFKEVENEGGGVMAHIQIRPKSLYIWMFIDRNPYIFGCLIRV